MSFREHPLSLRQNFVKLWPNNIFLPEEKPQAFHFVLFYKTQILAEKVLKYWYTKVINYRTEKNEQDFDQYLNTYKYQKSTKKRRRRHFRGRWNICDDGVHEKRKEMREERAIVKNSNYKTNLLQHFIKIHLYEQRLRELVEVTASFFGLLLRIREPIRRLNFLSPQQMKWFRRYLGPVQKEKHFINTLHQVVFLHYYKGTSSFARHFGRELEKVHKKVHWRLIHSFRNLLLSVPVHPLVHRQYYGLLIEIKGRPRGRARTFIFRMREGSVAPQSYFFRISFGMGSAFAKVGVLGVKTWITY
jgi:hypothetical protein